MSSNPDFAAAGALAAAGAEARGALRAHRLQSSGSRVTPPARAHDEFAARRRPSPW